MTQKIAFTRKIAGEKNILTETPVTQEIGSRIESLIAINKFNQCMKRYNGCMFHLPFTRKSFQFSGNLRVKILLNLRLIDAADSFDETFLTNC